MVIHDKTMANQFNPDQPVNKQCEQIIPLTGVEVNSKLDLDDYKRKSFFFTVSNVPGNIQPAFTFCCLTSVERDKWVEVVLNLSNLAVNLSDMQTDCKILRHKLLSATTLLKMNVGERLLENILSGKYKRGSRRYEEVRVHLDDYFKIWEGVMSRKMKVHDELLAFNMAIGGPVEDGGDEFAGRGDGGNKISYEHGAREVLYDQSSVSESRNEHGGLVSDLNNEKSSGKFGSSLSNNDPRKGIIGMSNDRTIGPSENRRIVRSKNRVIGSSENITIILSGDSEINPSGDRIVGLSGDKKVGSSGVGTIGPSGDRPVGSSRFRSIGPSGDRIVGPSGERTVVPSVDRTIGPSGDRPVGSSRVRTIGPSGERTVGPSGDRKVGFPEDKTVDPSGHKKIGPSVDRKTGSSGDIKGGSSWDTINSTSHGGRISNKKKKQSRFGTKQINESDKSDKESIHRSTPKSKQGTKESVVVNHSHRLGNNNSQRYSPSVASSTGQSSFSDVVNKAVAEFGGRLPGEDAETKKSILLRKIVAEFKKNPQSKVDLSKISAKLADKFN